MSDGARPFSPSANHLRVVLRDIRVAVRVGLHPWERHPERPTSLVVNVELYAATDRTIAADGRPLIDYDPVRDAVARWPSRPHTPLLETLAEELVAVCFEQAAVDACRVSVIKPEIYADASGAGVELFRVRP